MDDAGVSVGQARLRWETPQPWEALQARILRLLLDCDRELMQRDPQWLGHVKILAQTHEQAAYASLTAAGESPSWNGSFTSPVSSADVTLYAAVWAMAEEEVATAVRTALQSWQDAATQELLP